MPQSLSNILLHVVFSAKERRPFLQDPAIRQELFKYSNGILKNLKCPSLIINGVADHVHILCQLARTIAVADLLKELKTSTSVWIKTQSKDLEFFQWQAGYGVFSVSQSNVEAVKNYIEHQEEHHRTMSYQDEYRELGRRHGVEIDERYVWD